MSDEIIVKGVFASLKTDWEGMERVDAVESVDGQQAIVPRGMKHHYQAGDIINCRAVRNKIGLLEVTSFFSAVGFGADPER